MAAPADLSKLRINRDPAPSPVRKALRRNLVIFGVALVVVVVTAPSIVFSQCVLNVLLSCKINVE